MKNILFRSNFYNLSNVNGSFRSSVFSSPFSTFCNSLKDQDRFSTYYNSLVNKDNFSKTQLVKQINKNISEKFNTRIFGGFKGYNLLYTIRHDFEY